MIKFTVIRINSGYNTIFIFRKSGPTRVSDGHVIMKPMSKIPDKCRNMYGKGITESRPRE